MRPNTFKRFALLTATAIAAAGLVPLGPASSPFSTVAMAAESGAVAADKAILPYLEDDTFIVARLDVEKVDQDELQKLMEKAMDAMFKKINVPAAAVGQAKAQAMQGVGEAKQWLTDLAQAGGKHVYILLGTSNTQGDQPPALVVPFEKAEDASKIQGVLTRNGGQEQAVEAGKAVVFARPEQVERLQKRVAPDAKPVDCPHLVKALAAAGDAPLRVAYVPGETTRKWIEEKAPTLPAMLGGGDSKVLSRGVQYASVAMVQKPQTVAKVSVHCTDADQAKKLAETLTAGVAAAKDQVAGDEDLQKGLEAAKPKVAGETVSFEIDPVAVQLGMMGIQMRAAVAPGNAPAAPAPAKAGNNDGL
jgi:hypothetical protein